MQTQTNFDVIVVGGGAIGLAAARSLGQRGASVLVLEQFSFGNQQGSSAGVSRQFRIPYPDAYMVQMALDALPCWDELQTHAAGPLLDKVGTLWFGDPAVQSTEGNIAAAKQALTAKKVPYDNLTAAQVESQFGFRNLPGNYEGLFQQDGASIDYALTLRTLLRLNQECPTTVLREHAPVTAIRERGGRFRVRAGGQQYECAKLVLTPGPYVNQVLGLLRFDIGVTYWEMSSAYFRKLRPDVQYPTWFVFQPSQQVGKDVNGNEFYGFPGVSWDLPGHIRVAPDFVLKPLRSPGRRTGRPDPKALRFTADWVREHMTGLDPTPTHTSTCLIALSTVKDKELVLDFAPPSVPGHENIVVYATGWAAKFVPLLGRILADLALDGHTRYDISHFQLGPQRFRMLA